MVGHGQCCKLAYLYFAMTAGVVNGDGYCRKIFDLNTYTVFYILYLKITAKSIFYNCVDGDRHVGIYASPDNWRTCFSVRRIFGNGCVGRGLV